MVKKVVISNFAWIDKNDLSESDLFLLKRRLTIIPKATGYDDEGVEPIYMFKETDDRIGIPRVYWSDKYSDGSAKEIIDVSDGAEITPNVKSIALRKEDQELHVSEFIKRLKMNGYGGGIFSAYTGYGKSVSGIEMILRLGGRALILVHKEPLKEQWSVNIKRFYPNAKIGFIQGKNLDYAGCDIVIGMVQTLFSGRDFPFDLYRSFRTVIVDEVHRFGALKFGSVAPKFNARYFIGLSGTVRRKDGCEDVFRWIIGDILVTATEENRLNPIVYIRETGYKAIRTPKFNMDDFKKPTLLGFISKSSHRNHLIAQDVIKALKSGRNPLVMAERLDLLDGVSQAVYALGQTELGRSISNGMYIGGKSKEELARAASCDVVYATTQLAQEGIDIPRLDTLFLTTPVSDPEQAIGRVCRNVPGKKKPMIVDYLDSDLKLFEGIFHSRARLYKRLGWSIIGMNI